MIDLLAHDERAALGLQAILDLEKIPYRRVLAPEEASASLLVVTGDALTPAEIAVIERMPVLEGKSMFIVLASTHKPKVVETPHRPGRPDEVGAAATASAALDSMTSN